jgi:hypothetical protein
MTLKKLIEFNTWPTISLLLMEIYPEAEKNLQHYKMVFEELTVMDYEEMDISIVITKEKDEVDGEEYIDVSGLHNHPKNIEESYSQGIEFVPWEKWLGMDISKGSFDNFSQIEIIVHCLYEMTYLGFYEEDIQKIT